MLRRGARALLLVQRQQQQAGALAGACLQSQGQQQQQQSQQQPGCVLQGLGHQQLRFLGGDKVPEFWGKPSAYTEGTQFLGTPQDHMERIKARPLSPDVLEIDGKSLHYKMPFGALSSIMNRITGVALSVGTMGAAWIALRGDIGATVQSLAATNAIVLFPFKFAVCYTIFYHWLGGLRHFVWDHHKIGNQADKSSLLELPQVELSSKVLFGAAAVLSFIAAVM